MLTATCTAEGAALGGGGQRERTLALAPGANGSVWMSFVTWPDCSVEMSIELVMRTFTVSVRLGSIRWRAANAVCSCVVMRCERKRGEGVLRKKNRLAKEMSTEQD